jgi:hypothetical protein
MKYAVEMGSGAMIYIPSFINIGSGIQKLRVDSQTDRHRKYYNPISLLFFSKKELGLKVGKNLRFLPPSSGQRRKLINLRFKL